MGGIHPDTPRMDNQTEHTTGLCRHYCRMPTPMAQRGTTDTIFIILPWPTRGRGTTSRLSWMTSTTRRMPRPRMDLRPTELLRMARIQKKQDDGVSHRSSLNYGMQLRTNGITAEEYCTIQKTTLPEKAEHMELQIRREKETGLQTLPDEDRGLFAGSLESLLSIRDFEYQTISTRARQKTNTRGMEASTGVDDELATQRQSHQSINQSISQTHHITPDHSIYIRSFWQLEMGS